MCARDLVVAECAAAAPGVDGDGRCLFQGGPDLCPGGLAEAVSTCAEDAGTQHCAAAHPRIRRFCACVPPPTASPTASPTAAPMATTVRRQARDTGRPGPVAGSSAAGPTTSPDRLATVLLPLLGYVSLGGSKVSMVGGLALALASLASLAEPSNAHNWMMTPSRATGQASTTGPCRGRRSPDDKHAQVGTCPLRFFPMYSPTPHSCTTVVPYFAVFPLKLNSGS